MSNHDLAIVGMVCNVPGAKNIDEFWSMLSQGQEGLRLLTEEERRLSCTNTSKSFVFAGGFIDGIDQFDPDCFGLTSRDALFMDPQHRLFLQGCLQALEQSGNAGDHMRSVGVFASAGHNAYLTEVILKQGIKEQHHQSVLLGNSPDCLATRVSYCLHLTGPSMTVQSGCSSSLVALHQARIALLAKQCDAALVGGISLMIPHYHGYTPVEGGFASPDGHCRPFSHDANGTVFSSGYGIVVLKRLSDALRDGDMIYASIKGSAINNDGSEKASFTAPSVQGQAQVIAKAWRVAGVEAHTIQYIETHGTATPIGDPIEMAALSQVLQSQALRSTPCSLGSVKANIGHLDVAAGIIGLIKTSLMLHFKTMTPQINFKRWNPRITADPHLFQVNTTSQPWPLQNSHPLAGVSAFGFGGTNAHVVLEGVLPSVHKSVSDLCPSLIVLSAPSAKRLIRWIQCLHAFLQESPAVSLASLAYTLHVGRRQYSYRYSVQVHSVHELIEKLQHVREDDLVACTEHTAFAPTTSMSLDELQEQWLTGSTIDWSLAYSTSLAKIILPAMPLDLNSYWLVDDELVTASNIEKRHGEYHKWLYQTIWQERYVPEVTCAQQSMLLIGPRDSASLQNMQRGCQAHHVTCRIVDLDDVMRMESMWLQEPFKPQWVLHWVDLPTAWERIPDKIETVLRVITASSWVRSVNKYAFIVQGMSDLFCRDHQPSFSALIALSRGIRQEMPHLTTQLIDLDPHDGPDLQNLQIQRTMSCPGLYDYVVWRDNKCWQLDYQNQWDSKGSYFKPHGVYIITGGFGDVASVHIDFLAMDYQATLVVLGRTVLPSDDLWDHVLQDGTANPALKKRIQQLIDWRSRGFSIVSFAADVTKEEEFRAVCQEVHATLGSIDGIVHIAGVGSDMHYKVLTELTATHCQQLFLPKLRSLPVIDLMMKEFQIEQCLIISSISSALAGIGLAAYASVHNLLDAYVKKYHPHWRIMNWDAWNFHLQSIPNESTRALGASMNQLAITPDEGLAVLRTAFNRNHWQQVYVSTVDLHARVRQWVCRDEDIPKQTGMKRSKRKALRSEYVKASTLFQQQLIDAWESLIGTAPVGIHDNFFELGGDSLLALEFVSQMQKTSSVACTIMDLFAAGTVEKLAEKIQPTPLKQEKKITNARARAQKQRAALALFQDQ